MRKIKLLPMETKLSRDYIENLGHEIASPFGNSQLIVLPETHFPGRYQQNIVSKYYNEIGELIVDTHPVVDVLLLVEKVDEKYGEWTIALTDMPLIDFNLRVHGYSSGSTKVVLVSRSGFAWGDESALARNIVSTAVHEIGHLCGIQQHHDVENPDGSFCIMGQYFDPIQKGFCFDCLDTIRDFMG